MTVIDEYISELNQPEQIALSRVHQIIKSLVPDGEEVISYGMPVIKKNKKYVIGFSAFKNHMSLFPGSEAIEDLKTELTNYKTAKGTIQFTVDKPLSDEVIKKVIEHRLNNL